MIIAICTIVSIGLLGFLSNIMIGKYYGNKLEKDVRRILHIDNFKEKEIDKNG